MSTLSPRFQQLLANKGLDQACEWVVGIAQAMRQGVVVLDAEGLILDFNQFMCERYGWTDEDRDADVFAAFPVLAEREEKFHELVQSGKPLEILGARGSTRQGQEVYRNIWGYPLVADGQTMGTIILVEDITEFVCRIQDLTRVNEYLDDIVHSTHDAILVLDEQGTITFANDVALRYGGFRKAEDLVGCQMWSFIPPAERHAVASVSRKLLETGESGYLETQIRLADDRDMDVALTYARLRDRPGVIVILRDIGDRKQLERENARLFAKTQHQLQTMNRLFEASRVLTSTLDLQRVLELVIDAAAQSIPAAERGAVVLLDRERDELYMGAAWGYRSPEIQSLRFAANQGYAGWALKNRLPIRVDDVAADPRACLNSDWAETQEIRSAIAVPLTARDEPIGVLDLASASQTAAFTQDDLQLLTTFANQAAVAIENARLFDETQQRVAELNTLTQIGRAISAALDLDELLELVYQQASLVMDTRNFFIALYDAKTETVHFPLAVEDLVRVETRREYAPRRGGHALTEHVIQTRAPLLLRRDVAQGMADFGIEMIGRPALSWLGVPMMTGGRVLGVIAVQNYDREGAYSVEHLILLSTIAAQAAVAIENAKLYAQARRAEELATLNQISTLVTSSLNMHHVLDTIVTATTRVMHCQKAGLFIREEHEDIVSLVASHGLSERFVRRSQRIPLRHKRVATIRKGQVFAAESIDNTPADATEFRELAQAEGLGAFLDVPLRGGGRVLGSLTAYYDVPRQFTRGEIELLTTLANQAAVAIENARLYASTDERLRERVTELVALQQVSMRFTASLDLSAIPNTIAEVALRLVGANDVRIFLYDQESDEFTFGAGLSDVGDRNYLASVLYKDGIMAHAVQEGRPIIISDTERYPLYPTSEIQDWGAKAIASFPLKRADRVVGVFNVSFQYPHEFSEDELRVLGLLVDQAAIAIENARLYQKAQRLSITDGLTGLYNSRHFYAVLEREMAWVDRTVHTLSLIMIDIDNFKAYNDAHGHLAGDDLLQGLARLLRTQIRESDLAFRYGGEEFALLLPETPKPAAAQMAERIRSLLTTHEFILKETGAPSHVTVSMGVAMYPSDAADARGFVYAADMALYAAKAAGKNRVRVHDFPWSDPVLELDPV